MADLDIELADTFRYVHEPLPGLDRHRLVGRQPDVDELVSRIAFADGGSCLVTGYRGVGKTSYVNAVLAKLNEELDHDVVDVRLNLASTTDALGVIHALLRGTYRRLIELGLFGRFHPPLQQDLELAFLRTSAAVEAEAENEASRGFGLELGRSLFAGNLSFASSRRRRRALAYVAYDARSGEHDFIRIAREVQVGTRGRFGFRLGTARPIKLVVVLDELDKLEEPETVLKILGNLKTLFTVSGVSFIFVAGREIYDVWLADVRAGNSVLESVFAYAKYLPVVWDASANMFEPHLAVQPGGDDAYHYAEFIAYLDYHGRGLPRQINRALNSHVVRRKDHFHLMLDEVLIRRVSFYAQMMQALREDVEERVLSVREGSGPEALDQRRLGMLYLLDWALQRGSEAFTYADFLHAGERSAGRWALEPRLLPEITRFLFDWLIEHEYLESVGRERLADEDAEVVRVPKRRLIEIGEIVEGEVVPPSAGSVIVPGYDVRDVLGSGATANIYRAFDQDSGREVALKVGHSNHAVILESFAREVSALQALGGSRIVPLLGHSAVATGRPYIVLDFVHGTPLSKLVVSGFSEARVTRILIGIARALRFVHEREFLWLDTKPSNVILQDGNEVVLLDFGIALPQSVTQPLPDVLGSPGYVAPEMLSAGRVDVRSDLFSFGVMAHELLLGSRPFSVGLGNLLQDGYGPLKTESVLIERFPKLAAIILKCLATEPGNRFPSAAALLEALNSAVEDAAVDGLAETPPEPLDARSYDEPLTMVVKRSEWQEEGTRLLKSSLVPSKYVLRPDSDPDKPIFVMGELTLGRAADADVIIDGTLASRYHAKISEADTGVLVEDLNSSNGTFHNGERFRGKQLALPGDRIAIGPHSFLVGENATDVG